MRPLTQFRQVEGVRFGDFFDTFSRLSLRRLSGSLWRRILRILGLHWDSNGRPFGAKKGIFFRDPFLESFWSRLGPLESVGFAVHDLGVLRALFEPRLAISQLLSSSPAHR